MELRTIDTGKPTTVEVAGEGAPILIIGGAVPTLWANGLRDELVARGHRVVNYDYRAEEQAEPEGRTALRQVDDALAVMAACGLETPVVLGYSRGAVTAFALAYHHPDLVDRLVLLAPVAPFADVLTDVDPPELPDDPAEMLELFTREVFSPAYIDAHPQEVRGFMFTMSSAPAHVARVARRREEALSDTATVTCPTLLLVASEDQTVGEEHAARLQQAIRSATRIDLPGASHAVPIEEPERVALLVHEFAAG